MNECMHLGIVSVSQGHRKHSETLISSQSLQYDWNTNYTAGHGER